MRIAKQSLRQAIREQRIALSAEQQAIAAQALLKQVIDLDLFKDDQHIAAYVAYQGEIDPEPLIAYAQSQGKICYLPVISRHKESHVHFIKAEPNHRFEKNRYGIVEPAFDPELEIYPQHLDKVLVPLVAFDKSCHRLGMGGGYYDRVFSFVNGNKGQKPFLLGLAHDFQYRLLLPKASHDLQLHAVLTDKKLYLPNEF